MNDFKFAAYPSNSSVASGVTLLVSAWFLIAAGAILADPRSDPAHRSGSTAQPAVQRAEAPASVVANAIAIDPEARLTITVEASRTATL